MVAAQSEKKRGRLRWEDHVDGVQKLDGGARSVLPGCRFEDGVQVRSLARESMGLLALNRAPGAVAGDE